MNYGLITKVIDGCFLIGEENASRTEIKSIAIDSRNIIDSSDCLFFAIKGVRHDGHTFLKDLYSRGVRYFVVSDSAIDFSFFTEAGIILVNDSLAAMQKLAASVRRQFDYPVLGITGSNGKTIVKEWLFELLQDDIRIIRNPKSYNSQVGVPLSVWNMNVSSSESKGQAEPVLCRVAKERLSKMNGNFDLGIFEAGISQPGEMPKLAAIIAPSIGLLTNIGDAHQENFKNKEEKTDEKLLLFESCGLIIYRKDHELVHQRITAKYASGNARLFSWSTSDTTADLYIEPEVQSKETSLSFEYRGHKEKVKIPFTDEAGIENACHCLSFVISTERWNNRVKERFSELEPVAMRLELKQGINRCFLINDYYNSDINSLEIALQFMYRQSAGKQLQTLILSDIRQSGMGYDELVREVVRLTGLYKINRLICIGDELMKRGSFFGDAVSFYKTTDEFLHLFDPAQFRDEYILLKGAREFHFERIAALLQKKYHQTSLEVDLTALVANLNSYKALLNPGTKVMAMVKAFSYGSGNVEIARALEFNKVDYLAVAVADEGIELREAGIDIPIIVMNPEEHSFEMMLEFMLEPNIYSMQVFRQFDRAAKRMAVSGYPVHIKLETGMHRLGFSSVAELAEISRQVPAEGRLRIHSVFSHLAVSDDPAQDDFTRLQYDRFLKMSGIITDSQPHPVIRHLLNSAGVERFPGFQMEMVRLGIGLYGVSQSPVLKAETVGRWTTVVSQVKDVPEGETVGYGRKGRADKPKKIAVIPVGYADGFDRRLSNGVGKVWANGNFFPVIGNVCMDMTMIDVTGGNVNAGDMVEIMGDHVELVQLAQWINTISYEVLTGISQRVKRIYIEQ